LKGKLNQDARPGRLSLLDFIHSLWIILTGRPQPPPALAGNELLRIIFNRRSVRRFSEREIPEDVFTAILEAGRLAPSTVNLQTWTFAVFSAASWKKLFAQPIPFKAGRAVIILADAHRGRPLFHDFPPTPLVDYSVAVMNASLAAMNMNLAAEALGVSSVMLSETGRSGLLDTAYLQEKLRLPEGVFPIMTIVFGFPARAYPPMPPKLPLDQVCIGGEYREVDEDVLQDWIKQMAAGYKAGHPTSSLDTQLAVYHSKIGKAEEDLQRMVFNQQT
jgi:nitroreductase